MSCLQKLRTDSGRDLLKVLGMISKDSKVRSWAEKKEESLPIS